MCMWLALGCRIRALISHPLYTSCTYTCILHFWFWAMSFPHKFVLRNTLPFFPQALRALMDFKFLMFSWLDIAKLPPCYIYGLPPHPLHTYSIHTCWTFLKGTWDTKNPQTTCRALHRFTLISSPRCSGCCDLYFGHGFCAVQRIKSSWSLVDRQTRVYTVASL